MRILLLHNHYSVNGGEDIVFYNELNALKNKLGEDNVFEYQVGVNNISNWHILKSILFSRKQYKIVYDLIKKYNIDIVHIHNYFPILTVSVFKAAKDAGAKLVHTAHNYRLWCIAGNFYRSKVGICTSCVKKGGWLSGIKYKCYRNSRIQSIAAQAAFWFYRKNNLLNYVDKIITLTHFQQDHLIRIGVAKNKLFLKPNMVNFDCIAISPNDKQDYLYVGRLDESKGIELLLSTWVKLPNHFKLTIVGSGILGDALIKRYNQSNIEFLGELPSLEIERLMKKARYTIQPSLLFETFGLTIIESMRVGTPVIGLNIGTRPELIQNMKTGFISTPENLLETILNADKFDNYDAMSKNAQLFTLEFLPDILIDRQMTLYSDLISNSLN